MSTIENIEELPLHLRGNWAPLTEERTITDLKVTGTIPAELDGRYVRNGANPVTGFSDHPFLGDGMIHGIRLRGGTAEWYRNRYVQTPFISTPERPVIDLNDSLTDMAASKANTNVVGHAGQILALEEGHFPYVLDGNLDTVGPTDYDGKLKGSFTAHPKLCPVNGELVGFGYSLFAPYLTYLRVSATGELVQSENITVGGPTMMHDFNMTQNHVIFMDLPAVFDMDMAMRGEMPIHWSDDYPARLGVMPRNGNDASVVWYDINPCYVFHPMNAYEDGTKIILDVARLDHVWRDSAMDFPEPALYRWTIDTASGRVSEEQIDDLPAEFPRVPDSRVGLKHRFGYMMANAAASAFEDPLSANGAILKYDLETGARTSVDVGSGRLPGESSFVPKDGAVNEDDGYLMTYVYDANTDTSEFAIFDAATMSNEPVATVQLPRVPFGFHGNWVPSAVAD
ncbi:carotenoid oxygenase family protein [Ilumatobacter sp.]|uniref:carotenoid oxygenase family protein n=1 Tax=Ilumatobacter sp. TaxID=1967498 RepID=UPI003751B45B